MAEMAGERRRSLSRGERRPSAAGLDSPLASRPATEGGRRRLSQGGPPQHPGLHHLGSMGSIVGASADAAEQFKKLFVKQAFMKGAGNLVQEKAIKRQSAVAMAEQKMAEKKDTRPVLIKARDGSWRPLKSRHHISPPRVRNKLTEVRAATPQAILSEAGLLAAPTTRGHVPCLGRVTGAASPFGSLRREPLAALTVQLATGPTSRRALAALGPRATTAKLQRERDIEARAAMDDLDEFSTLHKDLLSGRNERNAIALRGTAAAAMSIAFKGRAMRFGKFRETKYASLWKSLGPRGVKDLYDSRVGGEAYTLSPVTFENMHQVFEKGDPELWQAIIEEDPTVVSRFFRLVDVNGDQKVTFSEFAAAVSLLSMSAKAQRNISIVFDSLDGTPPTGRLVSSSFSVSELYSTILPRVPADEDRQWRRALLGVHTIAEQHLKPTQSWGYSEFLEAIFTHFRRPLDDEFGHLTIHRAVVRDFDNHGLL
eukprot:Hpha_TRINITY_DN16745_c2_g2::TRINITY_DN16745_c2_g2_i1::g.77611::m.77611